MKVLVEDDGIEHGWRSRRGMGIREEGLMWSKEIHMKRLEVIDRIMR